MKDIPERNKALIVLCLEDILKDAELINEMLTDANYQVSMDVAAGKDTYLSFMKSRSYDIILADYSLPGFNAPMALQLAQELQPEVPFICVSGTIGEEKAVELLKQGATDYVLKDRPDRLAFAIRQALEGVEQQKKIQETEAEKLKLLHELEVHQIELKMQNQELILSHEKEAITAKKYIQLYDFAPSGYFTLSSKGEIIELNHMGAAMLGAERSGLKNSLFGFFVTPDTRLIFTQFLEKAFSSNVVETCELDLSTRTKLFLRKS